MKSASSVPLPGEFDPVTFEILQAKEKINQMKSAGNISGIRGLERNKMGGLMK